MTVADVHDGKERLARLSMFPAVLRLSFAPLEVPAIFVITSTNVVIRLAGIGRVISGVLEKIRIVANLVVRDFVTTSHRLRAV